VHSEAQVEELAMHLARACERVRAGPA